MLIFLLGFFSGTYYSDYKTSEYFWNVGLVRQNNEFRQKLDIIEGIRDDRADEVIDRMESLIEVDIASGDLFVSNQTSVDLDQIEYFKHLKDRWNKLNLARYEKDL